LTVDGRYLCLFPREPIHGRSFFTVPHQFVLGQLVLSAVQDGVDEWKSWRERREIKRSKKREKWKVMPYHVTGVFASYMDK